MRRILRALPSAVLFASPLAFAAEAPIVIHHEGRLLGADDKPVDNAVTLTVTLFDAKEGPEKHWSETYAVTPSQGAYSIALGDAGPEGDKKAIGVDDVAGDRWVGISIGGVELKPRLRLGSVPFAVHARHADDAATLGGHPASDFLLLGAGGSLGENVTAGTITATKFVGPLQGTADRATSAATADAPSAAFSLPSTQVTGKVASAAAADSATVASSLAGSAQVPASQITGKVASAASADSATIASSLAGSAQVPASQITGKVASAASADTAAVATSLSSNAQVLAAQISGKVASAANADTVGGKSVADIFANHLVASGRFLYLPFDENAGSTAWDLSGYRQDGALLGGVNWTAGRVGSALLFNGTTGCVRVADSSAQRPGSITLMAWVKRANALSASDGGMVLAKHFTNGARAFDLHVNAADNTFGMNVFEPSNTEHVLASPSTVTATLNTWVHVAGTYDAATGAETLYVNGAAVASASLTSFSPMATAIPMTVGCYLNSADGSALRAFWNGSIDEPSAFRRALSASEIAAYYNLTKP